MKPVTAQILVALFVSMLTFIFAFGAVWPSYALKILESADSPLGYPISKSEGNLIASVVMLGSLPPILFIGYINEKFGRKRSIIMAGLCLALAWSIIATAKSVTQLVIGRFLTGFSGGMYMVSSLIFMSEVFHNSIRGTLLSIFGCMFNVGALFSYTAGWVCSYEVINYSVLTMVVMYIVVACFLKETPPYLLRNGRDKEALSSLAFYRGTTTVSQEILDELVDLRNQVTSDNVDYELENSQFSEKEKLNQESLGVQTLDIEITPTGQSPWKIFITSKSSHRAIILLSIILLFSILMGMTGVQTYAGQFFRRAAPDMSPDFCSVLLAIVLTISSAVGIVITDRMPRRVLMMFSCTLSAVFLGLLASMLRWSWAPEWGIPLMVVMFCTFYQLGAVNLPFVQIAESLTPEMKSFGSTSIIACMFISNFVVLFLFEPTVDIVGLDGIFFLFSFISFLTAALAYLFMRETRNVPLHVIQESYERGYVYRKHITY